MEKKLSEMSLEELWKLFPIYLTEIIEAFTITENKDLQTVKR